MSHFHQQTPRTMRLCLAASGGGHLRQLVELAPAWSLYDHFFITEDSPFSRDLPKGERVYFLEHFALGQASLGAPLKMVRSAITNALHSFRIIWRERPDVVLTTGAGAMFFAVLWARILGARIIAIETYARFDRPSKFMRLIAPLARLCIVQSVALSRFYPKAPIFDPFTLLEAARPEKKPLAFVTVGATLSFDRMVKSVAELKARGEIPENLLIQTGVGGYVPDGIPTVHTLPFSQIEQVLADADIVICHGGTGSMITALRKGCRVIVMPRLAALGEHYDDHQSEISRAFVERGLVTVARSTKELSLALVTARSREPISATTDPTALNDYLTNVLADMMTALTR